MSDETISEVQEKITSPLTDIEDIINNRPEFDDPKAWEYIQKATPWVKAQCRPEVRREMDVEYAKKFASEMDVLRKEAQAMVNKQMEEWRQSQKPLDVDELKTLLSQEYITFPIKIQTRVDGKTVVRDFTLCELPQVQEKKFVDTAQKKLIDVIEKAAALDWSMDLSTAQQLQLILNSLPETLDVAAELVAICLDPWGDDKTITSAWVSANISTSRISYILIAQGEVNKYRDFFSNGFRLFRSLKTR